MKNYEGKHLYGIDDPWDACVFDALARVNGCLHRTGMPGAASRLLEDMQDCIRGDLGGDGFPVRDIWFKTTETVKE